MAMSKKEHSILPLVTPARLEIKINETIFRARGHVPLAIRSTSVATQRGMSKMTRMGGRGDTDYRV